MTHVPYNGIAPKLQAMIARDVPASFGDRPPRGAPEACPENVPTWGTPRVDVVGPRR